jgi:hypothetical protein
VPDWTGDYDFDAAILRNSNSDLRLKLDMYVTDHNPYRPRTGYNSWDGYSGDD